MIKSVLYSIVGFAYSFYSISRMFLETHTLTIVRNIYMYSKTYENNHKNIFVIKKTYWYLCTQFLYNTFQARNFSQLFWQASIVHFCAVDTFTQLWGNGNHPAKIAKMCQIKVSFILALIYDDSTALFQNQIKSNNV